MAKPRSFKNSKTHVGPYESWIFGMGAPYRDMQPDAGDVLALAGLGEWKNPVIIGPRRTELSSDVTRVAKSQAEGSDSTKITAIAAVAAHSDRFSDGLRHVPYVFVEEGENPLVDTFRLSTLEGLDDLSSKLRLAPAARFGDWTAGRKRASGRKAGSGSQPLQGQNSSILRVNHIVPAARVDPSFAVDDQTGGAPVDNFEPAQAASGNKPLVIVGVIDDGLPFAHANFREKDDPKTTRIDYCWLQGSDPSPARLGGVPFGRELTGGLINDLIARHDGDEDAIYSDPASGAASSDPDTARNIFQNYTHGAHVMDRACGFQPGDTGFEERSNVRVIATQLPRTALDDTSGFGKDTFVLAGVHYILERAERIAQAFRARSDEDVHVLINISLGITGGPKNGKYQLERALDEVVDAYLAAEGEEDPLLTSAKIFMPAGNNFASQMHANFVLNGAQAKGEVTWAIQPFDRTDNFAEVWLDAKDVTSEQIFEALQFQVTSPSGKAYTLTRPKRGGDVTIWPRKGAKPGASFLGLQMSHDFETAVGLHRFMAIIAPTEYDDLPVAQSGEWSLSLSFQPGQTVFAGDLNVRCIIQRDEDPAGTGNGGRQSYFVSRAQIIDDPHAYRGHNAKGRKVLDDTNRHDPRAGQGEISGFGLVNGWSTKEPKKPGTPNSPPSDPAYPLKRHTVGGFTGVNQLLDEATGESMLQVEEPAPYSSAGTRDINTRPVIDVSAVSNRSVLRAGLNGAGTRSGSTTVLVGTSAAAPGVLRSTVLLYFGIEQYHYDVLGPRLGIAFLEDRVASGPQSDQGLLHPT